MHPFRKSLDNLSVLIALKNRPADQNLSDTAFRFLTDYHKWNRN